MMELVLIIFALVRRIGRGFIPTTCTWRPHPNHLRARPPRSRAGSPGWNVVRALWPWSGWSWSGDWEAGVEVRRRCWIAGRAACLLPVRRSPSAPHENLSIRGLVRRWYFATQRPRHCDGPPRFDLAGLLAHVPAIGARCDFLEPGNLDSLSDARWPRRGFANC